MFFSFGNLHLESSLFFVLLFFPQVSCLLVDAWLSVFCVYSVNRPDGTNGDIIVLLLISDMQSKMCD